MDAVAIAVCVWAIYLNYKRAKSYEETILDAVDFALDVAMQAYEKALCMEHKEIFSEPGELFKNKEDEVAEDSGAPV